MSQERAKKGERSYTSLVASRQAFGEGGRIERPIWHPLSWQGSDLNRVVVRPYSSCRRLSQPPTEWAARAIWLLILWYRAVCYFVLFSLLFMSFRLHFVVRFQLLIGTFPPRGTAGCATFPFRVSFHLSSSRPPATLAVCGRVSTLVSLIIAPAFSFNRLSSSRPPPATLAVRGRFLRVVCHIVATAFSFNCFSSRFSWL